MNKVGSSSNNQRNDKELDALPGLLRRYYYIADYSSYGV